MGKAKPEENAGDRMEIGAMNKEARDHFYEELRAIAGVLDMIFLINEADMWSWKSEELGAAILDVKNRATDLAGML